MQNADQRTNIILASQSPRRKYLLEQAGLKFTVMPSKIDESRIPVTSPDNYVTVLAEAKAERDAMLKEAKVVKDSLIAEAKEKAGEEAKKLVQSAREAIQAEKDAAISDMRAQMVTLSVEIAEKILRDKLEDSKAQKDLVKKLVNEADLN